MKSKIEGTVAYILNNFEDRGIEYAVLRNYENLPDIGNDLDLVLDVSNLVEPIRVMKKAKEIFNWDTLKIHYSWKSLVDDFTIIVFKYFDYSEKTALHVDFFGGFSVNSAPALSWAHLVTEKRPYRGFHVVSENHEIIMRGMQLSCAIRDEEETRISKLRTKIDDLGGRYKLSEAITLLDYSPVKNFDVLLQEGFYDSWKVAYWWNYFRKSPLKATLRYLERIRYRIRLSTSSLPGYVISCRPMDFLQVERESKYIVECGYLRKYVVLDSIKMRDLKLGFKVLSQGGIVIVICTLITKQYNNGEVLNRITDFKGF